MTMINIVGNLGDNPELRFTEQGLAVARFSVGVTKRFRNDAGEWVDGNTSWYDCSAFGPFAENVVESLFKGTRVIVMGDMEQRTYEKDGETRYAWGVVVRNVGIDLTFGTATFTKNVARPEQAPPAPAPPARSPKTAARRAQR